MVIYFICALNTIKAIINIINALSDVSMLCSVISLIASIIIAVVQYKQSKRQQEFEKRQDDRDEKRYTANLNAEATKFLQKYNSEDGEISELCLLPLCVMASKYNPIFPYKRQMYRDFCSFTTDIQKEILKRMNLDYKIDKYQKENNFYNTCIAAIEAAINEYRPGDTNEFYDSGKNFEYSIKYHANDKIPIYYCKADDEVKRSNEAHHLNQTVMPFEDHIINELVDKNIKHPICDLLKEDIWTKTNSVPTTCATGKNRTLYASDRANAYICCMIAILLPAYYKCDIPGADNECIDDYPDNLLYMEDLFLKGLHSIYIHLLHHECYFED